MSSMITESTRPTIRPATVHDWDAPMMRRPSQGEELATALRRLFGRSSRRHG